MGHLLYVVGLSVVFLTIIAWLSLHLYQYLSSQIVPGEEIVMGTFTVGPGLQAEAAQVGTVMASKLERLKRTTERASTGFGLVQTPLLAVPGQFRDNQSDARKRIESLNLKVKDVDINGVMAFLRSLTAPARPTLEGQLSDLGDRFEVRAELLWKGETIGSWVAGRTKTNPSAESLNDLYDDLLFQIVFDRSQKSTLQGDDVPNWRGLEAMTLGLESLQTYQQSLEYVDLKRALKYLERVPVHAPGYEVGHYFLGIAYGEDRQEDLAINMFAHVQRTAPKKVLQWTAAFQRATAMLRQYQGPVATEAAKVLETLISELEKYSGAVAEEKSFARRLLSLAHSQLAYTYATLFTLNSQWKKPDLKTKAETSVKNAHEAFKKVTDFSSEQEKQEVQRWILNAEGYARFRISQFVRDEALSSGQPREQVLAAFRESCQKALLDLHRANEIRPNHYGVLQNRAMILDDELFDPAGTQLVEAEALYERTKLFVPRDYYQYERLARIYWRQVSLHPPSAFRKPLIDKGKSAAASAQTYRLESRTGAVLAAYFSTYEASIEADEAKKTALVNAAIHQASEAVRLNAPAVLAHSAATLMTSLAPTVKDAVQQGRLTAVAAQLQKVTP